MKLQFLVLAATAPIAAFAESITWIPVVPGTFGSTGFGVSQDGSVIVGSPEYYNTTDRAFRWTQDGGTQSLGVLPGKTSSQANAVSYDGSVVVGISDNAVFRWTQVGGMQGLGFFGNIAAVSGDGTTVVAGDTIWKSSETTTLGTLPGSFSSDALGVSQNGSVVVGLSGANAFRWTSAGGMQDLGVLAGATASHARSVSADGTVVTGVSGDNSFRWTEGTGMQNLGSIAGGSSFVARGMSQDGSVIVGDYLAGSSGRSFIWTQGEGMMDLDTLLVGKGLLTDSGFDHTETANAVAVSNGIAYITGYGTDGYGGNQGFLAAIAVPEPSEYTLLGGIAAMTGAIIRRRRK